MPVDQLNCLGAEHLPYKRSRSADGLDTFINLAQPYVVVFILCQEIIRGNDIPSVREHHKICSELILLVICWEALLGLS